MVGFESFQNLIMAESSSNSNSLIAQFEKSYAETMATLTQEDFLYDKSPETLKAELDAKITKFTDLARQMETFFLQKQFLVYAHKPELHLKDESTELRQEIQRKDEIIKKHNDRLANCLKMLQDVQQQQKTAVGPNMPMASPSSTNTVNSPHPQIKPGMPSGENCILIFKNSCDKYVAISRLVSNLSGILTHFNLQNLTISAIRSVSK